MYLFLKCYIMSILGILATWKCDFYSSLHSSTDCV